MSLLYTPSLPPYRCPYPCPYCTLTTLTHSLPSRLAAARRAQRFRRFLAQRRARQGTRPRPRPGEYSRVSGREKSRRGRGGGAGLECLVSLLSSGCRSSHSLRPRTRPTTCAQCRSRPCARNPKPLPPWRGRPSSCIPLRSWKEPTPSLAATFRSAPPRAPCRPPRPMRTGRTSHPLLRQSYKTVSPF